MGISVVKRVIQAFHVLLLTRFIQELPLSELLSLFHELYKAAAARLQVLQILEIECPPLI